MENYIVKQDTSVSTVSTIEKISIEGFSYEKKVIDNFVDILKKSWDKHTKKTGKTNPLMVRNVPHYFSVLCIIGHDNVNRDIFMNYLNSRLLQSNICVKFRYFHEPFVLEVRQLVDKPLYYDFPKRGFEFQKEYRNLKCFVETEVVKVDIPSNYGSNHSITLSLSGQGNSTYVLVDRNKKTKKYELNALTKLLESYDSAAWNYVSFAMKNLLGDYSSNYGLSVSLVLCGKAVQTIYIKRVYNREPIGTYFSVYQATESTSHIDQKISELLYAFGRLSKHITDDNNSLIEISRGTVFKRTSARRLSYDVNLNPVSTPLTEPITISFDDVDEVIRACKTLKMVDTGVYQKMITRSTQTGFISEVFETTDSAKSYFQELENGLESLGLSAWLEVDVKNKCRRITLKRGFFPEKDSPVVLDEISLSTFLGLFS